MAACAAFSFANPLSEGTQPFLRLSWGSREEKRHFLGAGPTYYFTLWACCDVRLYSEALQRGETIPWKPGSPGETCSVVGALGERLNLEAGLAFLTPVEKNPAFTVTILEESRKVDGGGVLVPICCCTEDPCTIQWKLRSGMLAACSGCLSWEEGRVGVQLCQQSELDLFLSVCLDMICFPQYQIMGCV